MLDTGYWILDTGFLMLSRRCERFSAKQSPDYLGLRLLRRYAPRKEI